MHYKYIFTIYSNWSGSSLHQSHILDITKKSSESTAEFCSRYTQRCCSQELTHLGWVHRTGPRIEHMAP